MAIPTIAMGEGIFYSDGFDYPVGSGSVKPQLSQEFLDKDHYHDLAPCNTSKEWCGHLAEDYEAPVGTAVYAASHGKVVAVTAQLDACSGWGNACIVKHWLHDGSIVYSQYAHLDKLDPIVKKDHWVSRGQKIGELGATGHVGPFPAHLDFQIKTGLSHRPDGQLILEGFGSGYRGAGGWSSTDNDTDWDGVTYYRPSLFIEDHRRDYSCHATPDTADTAVVAAWWNQWDKDKTLASVEQLRAAVAKDGVLDFRAGHPWWFDPESWEGDPAEVEIKRDDYLKHGFAYRSGDDVKLSKLECVSTLDKLRCFRIKADRGDGVVVTGYIVRACGNYISLESCTASVTARKIDNNGDALVRFPIKLGNPDGSTDIEFTDGSGYVRFTDLEIGHTYTLSEGIAPDDNGNITFGGKRYRVADPWTLDIAVSECKEYAHEFANTCLGKLSIYKFADQDLNGSHVGDNGVPNWPFHIDGPGGYSENKTTDSSGHIELTDLLPGEYTITERVTLESNGSTFDDPRPGQTKRWRIETPVTRKVTIDCSEETVRFLNVCLGSISVYKFNDRLNMDGTKQSGEDGVAAWPLRLTGTKADGSSFGPVSVTADSDGYHKFADLDPGTYRVSEEGAGVSWSKSTTECGGLRYCDWIATTSSGDRWLFTGVKIGTAAAQTDACNLSGSAPWAEVAVGCNDPVIYFGNVCLSDLKVCKFEDKNMDGVRSGEGGIKGWPLSLDGTRVNGKPICTQEVLTGDDGCYTFKDLAPGTYSVSESGHGIVWEEITTTCGAVTYSDWRTTWGGHRWQSTTLRPPAFQEGTPSAPVAPIPTTDPITIGCDDQSIDVGNVCLTTVPAFKFHDLNMDGVFEPAGETFTDTDGDGKWDPAEPLTDLNCSGDYDPDEFFRDLNGNQKWDDAEHYVDFDADKHYDWPECPLENWPFALTGKRADGLPVCAELKTNAQGMVEFLDVAPSDSTGYDLHENLPWCDVNIGWPDPVKRASYDNNPPCNGPQLCEVQRWQATTPVSEIIKPYCQPEPVRSFGNVCLTTVSGVKKVFDDAMPGESDGKPGVGWEICLAGEDHNNNPVRPSEWTIPIPQNYVGCDLRRLCDPASADPIAIPCYSPVWYKSITDQDGKFMFVDLLPGHYHLTEQPNSDYKLRINKPMLCGFDLMCCPETGVEMLNIRKGLTYHVYQAYPADSEGQVRSDSGFAGSSGDLISSVQGVLSICPGENWSNFVQSSQLCRETKIKSVILTKQIPDVGQCADVFNAGPNYPGFSQQGSRNVRLWWPLVFEPPMTTFTLKLAYGTKAPVRFPGEDIAGYIHTDEWKWTVDADVDSVKQALALFHTLPWGTCEVPLISDEDLYAQLQSKLDDVAALAGTDDVAAGESLIDFEMLVQDACVAVCPQFAPEGYIGVVNTDENPVCCKLLTDAEYLGRKLGIWASRK